MTLADRGTIGVPTLDEATGGWSAPLTVDHSDPVFFDHNLDHLPGMLILHGIAELVERASLADGGRAGRTAGSFDLDFTRFAEKDLPATVTISPSGTPDRWAVAITQSGHVLCAGTTGGLELSGPAESVVDSTAPAGALADAALVHRSRPENIVISPLRTVTGEYAVDYAPSEAVRTRRFVYVHAPLDVLEAARQFMILLSHSVCGRDLGTKLILTRLVVRTPALFSRAAPVTLRAARPVVERNRLDFTIRAHSGGAPATTVRWDVKALTPAVYARLRGVPHD